MAFGKDTKFKALSRANWTCCYCRVEKESLHVHHILPQGEGGPDTLDNAAVMCATCHGKAGHDTAKRSDLINRRDDWNDKMARLYPDVLEGLKAELRIILAPLDQAEAAGSDINELGRSALMKLASLLPPDADGPEAAEATDLITRRVRRVSTRIGSAAKLRATLWATREHNCERCAMPFEEPAEMEIHHATPLSEDGPDDLSDVLMLCPNCHRAIDR